MIPLVCLNDANEWLITHAESFGLVRQQELPEQGQYLLADAQGLALCKVGEKGLVRVDFTAGPAHYRRTKGGGELLARAVAHAALPTVWDATGGLGRDAFVLASLGLKVRIFERNPVVACLLADGLARAKEKDETAGIVANMFLQIGDATQLMAEAVREFGFPDVVYLDPMYPERQKSAAVKKEMAYFHDLVGLSDGEAELLSVARNIARKRVVVKRPRLGVFLNGRQPDYQYAGKSVRFDVYLPFSLIDR